MREKLPEELKSALRSDLNRKQLSGALKMVSRGLEWKVPLFWFTEGAKRAKMAVSEELPRPGALEGWSIPLRKTGGRNHHGKITVRHRGGGYKRRIRILDTFRNAEEYCGGGDCWRVERIEHDPNRSAKIALIRGQGSANRHQFRYILATEKMQTGSIVSNSRGPTDGACLSLKDIPLGSQIHSIESSPGRGGQLVRSAGTCATLVGKDLDGLRGSVRLPSGKIKKLLLTCRAVIGRVGNVDWQHRVIGKAGRMRNLGRRPVVRGVAMNAVDHPHGGGKGGRSKGKPTQSIWGWVCK